MVENAQYSYSSDVSVEFQQSLTKLTKDIAHHMDRYLAVSALGGDSEKPFGATRDGDVVHLVYPQHVKEGDLLGGLLTILATQIPTCVIHQGTAGWSEPEWSTESRAHLAGLVSGLHRVPDSFSHTTSPTDLARVSMWVTACSAALSVPGGVADAHGDVLPSVLAGGKSASKYMTKVISGLRSNVTDESIVKAIDTLGLLLKMWQRARAETALGIVRKCKIAWSTVLYRAAPTSIIKGKRGRPDQTVIRSPAKPSKSPWLSKSERSELGSLFRDDWSHLDTIREQWVALSAEQHHRQFNSFIKTIKAHYENLNNISNSVHAKLGKRKNWIEIICKEDNFKPKVKRDESPNFALAEHFFSKTLSNFDMKVKRIFAPVTYLPDKYSPLEIWNGCFPDGKDPVRITSAEFSSNDDGPAFKLWQIWADMFLPIFTSNEPQVEEAPPTEDRNIFSKLLGLAQG
jgi:hypothetical protein